MRLLFCLPILLLGMVACKPNMPAPEAKSSNGVSMTIKVEHGEILFAIRNDTDEPRFIYTSFASLKAEVPSSEPDYYKKPIITDDGRQVDQMSPSPKYLTKIEPRSNYEISKNFTYHTPTSGETITATLSATDFPWFEKEHPDFMKEHRNHLLKGDVIAPAIICP